MFSYRTLIFLKRYVAATCSIYLSTMLKKNTCKFPGAVCHYCLEKKKKDTKVEDLSRVEFQVSVPDREN